ncbi:coiled-coil domain-containing protein 13 [Ctenodactylus gundi]
MAAGGDSQGTLQLQFKAMQELQHRRLQRRMQKREKGPSPKSCAAGSEEAAAEGRPDGPGSLHSGEQNPTTTFQQSVLEAETQQLREELRETVDENGRLHKLLNERDFEIRHLKKKLEEDRLAFTGTAGVAGDIVATKIVELSKRNRMLMAESEAAKTRVKQLRRRVQELEGELQTALARLPAKEATSAGARSPRAQMEGRAVQPESPEVKALQDRLAATSLKMSDLRNQVQAVKQELRTAHKVLASEVGEDVSIPQLLAAPGTWRGRAQQILVLQSKVRELEKQLGQTRGRSAGAAGDVLPVHADAGRLSAQERNLLRIRSLEKGRQEGWEKLAGERDALRKELEEGRTKYEGLRARNRVLAGEVKALRGQVATLAEKGRHDDELIDALVEQLKQLQEVLGSLSRQDTEARTSRHHLDQQARSEAQRSSNLVAQLRAMVAEREAKVRQLELEIGQLGAQYLQDKGLPEGHGGSGASLAHPSVPEEPGLATSPGSADDHAGRLGSARSVSSLGHTLVESALTRPSRPGPHGTPPRFPDSQEQKSWQAQVAEVRALWQAAEVERSRLTEFVTVLQKRVEESHCRLLRAEGRLQEERLRCVVLEQHLEKMRLEPGRAASRPRAGQPASSSLPHAVASARKMASAQRSEVPVDFRVEELTARLAIQAEENEALKATLGSALQGKEEDLRMYHETLGQVKGVFLQALRQQKSNAQ